MNLEKSNSKKFKKILFFLLILSLPFEIALFSIGGKEIKVWFLLAILGGTTLLWEIYKKGLVAIKNLKSLYIGLALIVFSLISLVNSPIKSFSLKQLVVLFSLIVLSVFFEKYSKKFGKELLLGLSLGMIISSVAAILQNLAFSFNLPNFEVMAARPNAFLPEPDWLGFYLALSLLFFFYKRKNKDLPKYLKNKIGISIFLLINLIALIITVARASWLAFTAETGVFILVIAVGYYLKNKSFKETAKIFFKKSFYLISLLAVSLALIQVFGLTRFNLLDRVRSIFFKEHIVTLAENPVTKESFKIDLEEKGKYLAEGFLIKEAYVEDENVISRGDKAESALDVIKKHPWIGGGLGIMLIVTNYQHNANNLFLEWWASAGLGAFFIMVGALSYFLWKGLSFLKINPGKSAFLLAGVVGFVFLNLFNASIFLAFAWFFLGYMLGETEK